MLHYIISNLHLYKLEKSLRWLIKASYTGFLLYIIYTMNARDSNDQQTTTMTKIIILQCLDLNFSQSFQVNMPYYSHTRELDLGHSLHHLLESTLHYDTQLQIFYFHPVQQLFQYAGIFPFKYPLLIGEDFIVEQEISIRMRRLNIESEQNLPTPKEEKEEREKRKRGGSRTIRQVLQKVSQWRSISQKNTKINLQEGAKMVGIPKKTLDDYYAHIKLGSQFNFDFQQNLDQNIGILRSFVKEKNMKKKYQFNDLQFLHDILKYEDEDSAQQQEQ